MLELIDTQPDLHVQESEYKRLLGYPRHHELADRPLELARWARDWYAKHGQPWIYGHAADLEIAGDQVRIAGTEFSSRLLRERLSAAEAHSVMLVAVSAGRQCEEKAREAWQEAKPDEYFFLEMYGSAVVEHLVTLASGQICGWADANGLAVLPHYSPGYTGWDVADQNKLWSLIHGGHERALPGELEVMHTGMLRPKKSLLAVFGLTRNLDKARSLAQLIPCENCALPRCQYRRTPYRHSLPQIEDVHHLQNEPLGEWKTETVNSSPLTRDAKYSIHARALRKWSQERLKLTIAENGALTAQFRYEGTTCTNLGRTLEFDYQVRLGPPEGGYVIEEMDCAPAPGDTGHAFMCEYLSNADTLMRNIAIEKPLLGQPLDDVLTWKRHSNPSGCHCDADRRTHKWSLVLEVLHYGLVQRMREKAELAHGQNAPVLG